MASSNLHRRHVGHQRPKRQKASESEDRISNLPENILNHIFSCLPTKNAVGTSVLSKRWLYLWTSITKLDFNDTLLFSDKKRSVRKCFGDFVLRVLLHLTNPTTQSFTLDVANKYDSTLVNAWISAILNRKVRKFSINYPFVLTTFSSSYPLFNCKSLEELVLDLYSCCSLRVPAYVCLPNLKTLKLSGLLLKCDSDSSSHLKELILNFPVLKKFECQNCIWLNVQNVNLQVPLLEIVYLQFEEIEYEANNCTIKFCDPHLKQFSYYGSIIQDYVLSDPSSAFNASAIISLGLEEDDGRDQVVDPRAFMLLKQFSQVKYLKLGQPKAFVQAKDSFDVPEFRMLHHLQLGFVGGEMLMGLLSKLPNLTTLDIKGISRFNKQLSRSAIVPDCIANLKVVKLGELNGYPDELCLAKFVMEKAIVLKQLSFSPTWSLRNSKSGMEQVREKISSFKKGLNLTIIDFSDF